MGFYQWSFSKMSRFETCPYQFYRIHIKADVKDTGNYATSRGGRIHKALENYVKHGEVPDDSLEINHYLPVLDKVLSTAPPDSVTTEEKYAVNDSFEATEFFANDVFGRAVSDLCITFEDARTAILVDYKTGKDNPDKFRKQAKVMGMMKLMNDYDLDKVFCVFHNLDTRNYKTKFVVEAKDVSPIIDDVLRHTDKVAKLIEEGDDMKWPRRQSGLCKNWCLVKDCEFNGG